MQYAVQYVNSLRFFSYFECQQIFACAYLAHNPVAYMQWL